ncbi:MAG: beta-lactamase family protein [Bacteroidales bacterium]|nr:beta-lactamase family protein [Bacteroidales bacterium]
MNLLKQLVAIPVLAALLPACSGHHDAGIAPLCAPMDSLLTTVFPSDTEPGAVVLVMKDDSTLYSRAFGLARISEVDTVPFTDSTLTNICSISKQFAAVAMLKLAEQGKISLDDPVSKYFPEFRAAFFDSINIRHLLSHTSGLPDTRPRTLAEWEDYVRRHPDAPFAGLSDYKLHAQSQESVKYMEDLDSLVFAPGTAYEYQNPTFQLAELIVERVTGEPFTAWMKREIFEPAGMRVTVYFEPSDEADPRFAHAYSAPESTWVEDDYGETNFFPSKADGAIFTTPREFYSWLRAFFGGKIVGEESVRQAITPVIATDIPGSSYGLGFFLEQAQGRPLKVYHTGDNGGFFTYEAYYPEQGVAYMVFANRADWSREDTAAKIDSILIAKRVL